MMSNEKKKVCENIIIPPAHTTYCTPSSHFPMTIPPYLHLCRPHHQLILYLDDEVAYLSVAAPNTPHESLWALEKQCGEHLRNPQISRTSSSHEGIYLAARKQAYLCMKC